LGGGGARRHKDKRLAFGKEPVKPGIPRKAHIFP